MPRTRRGGSASSSIAMPSIAPSQAKVLPAWFAISSTRPSGTCSMPWVSTRSQWR